MVNGEMIYTVRVDHARTIKQMIAAGNYDSVGTRATEAIFDLSGSGEQVIEIVLVHPGKQTTTDEVLRCLGENGMRPATIQELLAFGERYPEVQRRHSVVSLDMTHCFDRPNAPYLAQIGEDRIFDLEWVATMRGWNADCRFAAVRK